MRSYIPCFILTITALYLHSCCAWVPGVPAIGISTNYWWNCAIVHGSRCPSKGSKSRSQIRLLVASGDVEEFGWDFPTIQEDEEEGGEIPISPTTRLKMEDDDIPDYLVDMLRESGFVDDDGKPIDEPDGQEEQPKYPVEDENYMDVPFGDMLSDLLDESPQNEDTLMDCSITEISHAYGFPLEFFQDTLTRWGCQPPINAHVRLGDFATAEQAAGLVEALTGLDAADVSDNYVSESLEDLSIELNIPLPKLFQACTDHSVNLPEGADTHLSIEDYKMLLDNVVDGGEDSPARLLFDENRMSNRWSGMQKLKESEKKHDYLTDYHRWGREEWRNGPPVIGPGEGQIPLEDAHISGHIFGEDLLWD
ncbi:unnamed protein product [Choristocarpus tenellus]